MSDVFSETTEAEQTDYLEQLVGEGKKFKDPEALARGKAEADEFIENLKRQNQELKEDLEKASKLDQILEEIRSNEAAKPSTARNDDPGEGEGDPSKTSSGLTDEQLQALIEKTLSQRETEGRANKNLSEVNRVIGEKYGSKAAEFLKSRADEIGLSVVKMKELAAENPKAFYRLVGLDGNSPNKGVEVGGNRLNSESSLSGGTNQTRADYYRELRKADRRRYFSPEVQMQMFKEIKELGKDVFYGNK